MQARQQLPFAREKSARGVCRQSLEELQRRRLHRVVVVAFGTEYSAHAAVSDLCHQAPCAQHIADPRLRGGGLGEQCIARTVQGRGVAVVAGAAQRQYLGCDPRRNALPVEQSCTLPARAVDHFLERLADSRVVLTSHRQPARAECR